MCFFIFVNFHTIGSTSYVSYLYIYKVKEEPDWLFQVSIFNSNCNYMTSYVNIQGKKALLIWKTGATYFCLLPSLMLVLFYLEILISMFTNILALLRVLANENEMYIVYLLKINTRRVPMTPIYAPALVAVFRTPKFDTKHPHSRFGTTATTTTTKRKRISHAIPHQTAAAAAKRCNAHIRPNLVITCTSVCSRTSRGWENVGWGKGDGSGRSRMVVGFVRGGEVTKRLRRQRKLDAS